MPEFSRQLHDVLRREGIGRAHLMGISLGGSVAARFAGTHPETVDRLVLADCTSRYDDESRAKLAGARRGRAEGRRHLARADAAQDMVQPAIARGGRAERAIRSGDAGRVQRRGYALACEALATVDARAEAERITAPTLILCGSEERQAFRDAAAWLHRTIRGSRLEVVPVAGHASVRERPEHVIGLLRVFVT